MSASSAPIPPVITTARKAVKCRPSKAPEDLTDSIFKDRPEWHGFRVTLNFDDVPGGLRGLWSKGLGQADDISIYALNNAGTRGSASTFMHEARHAIMNARGINQGTMRAEYMARARE